MDTNSNQQNPAHSQAQALDLASQAQIQQPINASVKSCFSNTLPQVLSEILPSMNVQAEPQAQMQHQGLSAESVEAAMAAALTAQKDRPNEPIEPFPSEDFLVPTETEATNAVVLEPTKIFKTPPNLRSLKITAEDIPQYQKIPVSAPARTH